MSSDGVQRVFDRVADRYDRYASNTIARRVMHVLLDSVQARLPVGSRVADVGCGPGHLTIALARRGYRMTGIDISDRMLAVLAQGSRAAGLPIDALRLDITRDELSGGPYAAVIASLGPINYTRDPSAIFSRVRRALTPDGILFLVAARGASLPRALLSPRRLAWPLLSRAPLHRVTAIDGERLDLFLWDPVVLAGVLAPELEVVDMRAIGLLPRAPERIDVLLGRQPLLRRLGAATLITARAR